MKLETRLRLQCLGVWLARLIVGFTFIISGWAKAIDPWGFLIKTGEYLQVWHMSLPREVVLTGCVGLACVEFCTGILVATGSLKRFATWIAAAMMAVMLPLTAYIAIASPVSDCGCFGDFLVISNTATLLKNIVLAALIIYLLKYGPAVKGIYAAPIQWLQVAVSLAFPLFLAFVGYNVQPVVDFRPYKLGTELFAEADASTTEEYIYEKDGVQRSFGLDSLPDDSWTFVDMKSSATGEAAGFDVTDSEGFDISDELTGAEGPVLYLIVADPDVQYLSRTHLTNLIYRYAVANDVEMKAIAGASGESLDEWVSLAKPQFEVYSAAPTALKQLVRGDAALVYTDGGIIKWKRTLSSVDEEAFAPGAAPDALAAIEPVDDGRLHLAALGIYLAAMIVIYALSLSPKILRLFAGHAKKNA